MDSKLLNININQLGITKYHLHVFHHTAFIHTQKITARNNKNTAPSIIHRLRHHNPNYIMNISFIWNDGLIAIQFQYQSTGYHKVSYACVPLYSLYSHSNITAHTNNNTDPLIIPRLMWHMNHWVHRNPNYIVSMYFIWNGGLETTQYQY